ncbi:MAG: selenocysteine-specific translation elongation factor [Actinomycetota bacterium]
MKQRFVISTAGHVDHGKSALIQRMTGIDPDRLAEEKERGMTIDLGFAWMRLPSGRDVGIVDVPGHERFIHNMLAGVGSVDSTIFVVAANEGWMPQSEEHLAILDLLGARRGVVALTKCDLVEAPRLAEVQASVAERLDGTSLAGAEIVACSAVTGEGMGALDAAIDRMLDLAAPSDRARPRMFVDRAFTIRGAGTVVTGTLTGGALRTGQEVAIMPSGGRARIRAIQSHKAVVDHAEPVSRVALNLSGVDVSGVERGDAVVLPGQWAPVSQLDVWLRMARGLGRNVSARGAYKAYIGSAEVDAHVRFYDHDEIAPGARVFARVTLDEPVVAAPFDAVVLRDVGRNETVAGGPVLDAHPPHVRGSARAVRVEQLRARARSTPDRLPALIVNERGVVARNELARLSGSTAEPDDVVVLPSYALSNEWFGETVDRVRAAVRAFHEREPLAQGMPREEARARSGIDDPRLFDELLDAVSAWVESHGSIVRLTTHSVALSPQQEQARDALLADLRASGFSPPPLGELCDRYGEPFVRAMLDAGVLVKVGEDLVYSGDQLAAARAHIQQAMSAEGPLTAARIKDLLGTTRKWAIPLLEYLDSSGFTRRRGDLRDPA